MIYDSCNLCFYLLLKFNICLLATKLCSRYPSLRLCGKKFLVVFWMGKYLFMNNHHCLLLLQSKTSKAHFFFWSKLVQWETERVFRWQSADSISGMFRTCVEVFEEVSYQLPLWKEQLTTSDLVWIFRHISSALWQSHIHSHPVY